jgi:WD40 repeat protein
MTAFDRIERRMPEVFDDLAAARVPDYFDDMLRQTARTRQRPAWSALERWLPMGVIARPIPIRPLPWRLIPVVALLGLVAAAALLWVGSRPRALPAPFGLARNGALLIGTADGDIVTVDPMTGRTTPLISGPTADAGPFYSYDGRRFVFDRAPPGSRNYTESSSLYIANADGSEVRELFPGGTGFSFSWLPNSDRVLITSMVGGKGAISIGNVKDQTTTDIRLDLDVASASWRPNHDQVIVTANAGDKRTFWVVDADGTGLRQIPASEDAIDEPTLSPDGNKLAYAAWPPTAECQIRVVDIDVGDDHAITTEDQDGYVWQTPQFSPDGNHLVVLRFIAHADPAVAQLAIMDVATGSVTVMGPESGEPQPAAIFSPDATSIVVDYPALKQTWMFDADGQHGHVAPFSAVGGAGATWQRLAP